jgi:hypothetical protein
LILTDSDIFVDDIVEMMDCWPESTAAYSVDNERGQTIMASTSPFFEEAFPGHVPMSLDNLRKTPEVDVSPRQLQSMQACRTTDDDNSDDGIAQDSLMSRVDQDQQLASNGTERRQPTTAGETEAFIDDMLPTATTFTNASTPSRPILLSAQDGFAEDSMRDESLSNAAKHSPASEQVNETHHGESPGAVQFADATENGTQRQPLSDLINQVALIYSDITHPDVVLSDLPGSPPFPISLQDLEGEDLAARLRPFLMEQARQVQGEPGLPAWKRLLLRLQEAVSNCMLFAQRVSWPLAEAAYSGQLLRLVELQVTMDKQLKPPMGEGAGQTEGNEADGESVADERNKQRARPRSKRSRILSRVHSVSKQRTTGSLLEDTSWTRTAVPRGPRIGLAGSVGGIRAARQGRSFVTGMEKGKQDMEHHSRRRLRDGCKKPGRGCAKGLGRTLARTGKQAVQRHSKGAV